MTTAKSLIKRLLFPNKTSQKFARMFIYLKHPDYSI